MSIYIMGNIRERHTIERCLKKSVTIDGYIEKTGKNTERELGRPCYRILDIYNRINSDDIILSGKLLSTDGVRLDTEVSKLINLHCVSLFDKNVVFSFFLMLKYVKLSRWIIEIFWHSVIMRISSKQYLKRMALKEAILCKEKNLRMIIIGTGFLADYLVNRGKVSGWILGQNEDTSRASVNIYTTYQEILLDNRNDFYFYIIDSDIAVKTEGDLLELGFSKSQIYGALNIEGTRYNSARVMQLWDPLLGLNFPGEPYDGIDVFKADSIEKEDKQTERHIIVTLGNSTSDATHNNIKSWSEYLFEKIREKGYIYDIYSAGASAYTVSQEFLKLVRDILPLNPDIVISYSGVNDCDYGLYDEHSPCDMRFQIDQITKLIESGECENVFQRSRVTGITTGIKWNGTNYEHWLRTEKMMHDLCEKNNVKFYAFLQPHNHEYKYYMNSESNNYKEEFYKECGKEIGRINENWIIDISKIFIDMPNVFCDMCHVYEYGNKIIAETIFTYIMEDIKCGQL